MLLLILTQHQRDVSGTKQPTTSADSPHRPSAAVSHDAVPMQSGVSYTGKPTSHVGLTSSRPPPQIVSIRAGQGPSDSHTGTLLPKNHSATSVNRQGDSQAYDSRSQPAAQYYQQSAGRSQDTGLQTAPHPSMHPDGSRAQQHSSVNPGVPSSYQQPVQGYPNPASYSRHAEPNGVASATGHGSQQAALPDVVVRPPSAAPTQQDPYSSRQTVGVSQYHHGVVSGQHLQASHDSRARSTPAPTHAANQSHANSANAQQASYSHLHPSVQHPQSDPYRAATASAGATQQYGVSDLHRILASPAPHASAHAKGASQDTSSRFPVYEDTAGAGGPGGYGSQHAAAAYNPPAQATTSRTTAAAGQGYSSASPKRNLTYPGASAPAPTPSVHVNPSNYHGAPAQDARSPKPPSVATITQDTAGTRSQGHGTHGRDPSGHQPSPRYDQSAAQLAGDTQYAYASSQTAGHSPSRHHLTDPGRSPAIGHAVSVGSAAGTPKHSPSGRLHSSHRNGSNDTITHAAPTKPSPASTFQQQLPHRNSVINLQSNAASRLDNAPASRQPNVSPGYPEPARYRSPAPPGYPTQPQSAPNGNSANYSQSYSTQTQTTSYDQYGRPTAYQSRTAQPTDYAYRAQEPPNSAPPTATTMPVPNQRVPPRSAPSPAPTVRPTRLTAISSPTGKAPSLHPPPPQPTRNQTYPAPAPNPPPFPSAHSRTVSDPQYPGRAPNSTYPSGSLPSRGHSHAKPMANAALQAPDVLLTPSSLAPSMLPAVSSPVPLDRTTSKSSTKEKEKDSKKLGLLGRGLSLFRSRSSPPKPREVEPPPSAAIREKRQRNVSQPTQPLAQMQAAHVSVKPPPGAPAPQVAVATVSIPAPPQARRENTAPQMPVAAPTPIHGRRSPNGKMFTPFRLVAKRHHTVSTASLDAVDGTVVSHFRRTPRSRA